MLAAENQCAQEVQVGKELRWRSITLEPLRSEGQSALEISGFEDIIGVKLLEVEITYDNTFQDVKVLRVDDLFDAAGRQNSTAERIPKTGRITRGVFEMWFADSREPITVELRVPGLVILPQDSRAELVDRWLASSHFVVENAPKPTNSSRCETAGDASKNFPA